MPSGFAAGVPREFRANAPPRRRRSAAHAPFLAKICQYRNVRGLGTRASAGRASHLQTLSKSRGKKPHCAARLPKHPAAATHPQSGPSAFDRVPLPCPRSDDRYEDSSFIKRACGQNGGIRRTGARRGSPCHPFAADFRDIDYLEWGDCVVFADYPDRPCRLTEPFGTPCAHPAAIHRAVSLRAAGRLCAVICPLSLRWCARWRSRPCSCWHPAKRERPPTAPSPLTVHPRSPCVPRMWFLSSGTSSGRGLGSRCNRPPSSCRPRISIPLRLATSGVGQASSSRPIPAPTAPLCSTLTSQATSRCGSRPRDSDSKNWRVVRNRSRSSD